MTDTATLQTYLDEAPLHAAIGDLSVRVDGDDVVIEGTLAAASENGAATGVAHGGALATLLDTALAFALIVRDDRDWSTVDLRVDYLRPMGIAEVSVRARVVQAGRRTGRAEGEARDGSGAVCASAVGTFIPLD